MSKLLSANLSRMIKNKLFWLTSAVVLVFTAVSTIMSCTENYKFYVDMSYDYICFVNLPLFGLYCAFFISMFFGTEYSDFTVRNKLSVGHSRPQVFFANLFTCLIASGIFFLVLLISACAGVPFIGIENIDIKTCLLKALVGFFTAVSTASVFSVIAQLITRKAAGAVTAIFAALALIITASSFYNALCQPETTVEYVQISVDGGVEFGAEIPNPAYVGGAMRTAYETILRVLPTGQQIIIADEPLKQPAIMIALSLAVTITVSVIGYLLFRKKDLK